MLHSAFTDELYQQSEPTLAHAMDASCKSRNTAARRSKGKRNAMQLEGWSPKVTIAKPRTPTALIDAWLSELVALPSSPERRALKQKLTEALISDGHRAPNARVLADNLIAERRRSVLR